MRKPIGNALRKILTSCRAVCVPHAVPLLPQVRLKKEYNDAGSGPGSGRAPPHRLLSGSAWYSQQAFRALNQVSYTIIVRTRDLNQGKQSRS